MKAKNSKARHGISIVGTGNHPIKLTMFDIRLTTALKDRVYPFVTVLTSQSRRRFNLS